jgi:glyoxylase-like metal-dependent hydrolase (beta-lactamase superfamily II)
MTQEITIIPLTLPFGMGTVNCYLLRATDGYVLIDTGSKQIRKNLLAQLERAGCKPGGLKLIILTHGDFDHIGNAAYLSKHYGTRIAMHKFDAGMAEQGDMFSNRKQPNIFIRKLIPIFTGFGKSSRFSPDLLLDDGDDLNPYGLDAKIVLIPGHSKGSIGVLMANGDLFCGDLLVSTNGPALNGLIDDITAAKESVKILVRLNVKMVYPGHGQPFDFAVLGKITP